eukprot:3971494-Amphidinium_carterae.1
MHTVSNSVRVMHHSCRLQQDHSTEAHFTKCALLREVGPSGLRALHVESLCCVRMSPLECNSLVRQHV